MRRFPGTTCKLALPSLLALIALGLAGPLAAKEIYSWSDENGVPHFADLPPQGYEAQPMETPDSLAMQSPAEMEALQSDSNEQRLEEGKLCADHQERLDAMRNNRDVSYVDESGERHQLTDEQYELLMQESQAYLKLRCD